MGQAARDKNMHESPQERSPAAAQRDGAAVRSFTHKHDPEDAMELSTRLYHVLADAAGCNVSDAQIAVDSIFRPEALDRIFTTLPAHARAPPAEVAFVVMGFTVRVMPGQVFLIEITPPVPGQ